MGNLNNNWQSQVAKINLKNVSGQTIPPYACCELEYDEAGSATEMDGDEIVFRVTLPTADGVADSARIVFNGAGKIQDEAIGIGVVCPLIQSLWDYTTDPVIGQSCGATEDEWYLSTGGSGFTFKSVDATEAYTDDSVVDVKTAFFERAGNADLKYFVLAEDLATSSQEEVYVWEGEVAGGASIEIKAGQTEPFVLINVEFILSPVTGYARAGYTGLMTKCPDGDGRWTIVATYGCLNTCTVPEGYDIEQPTFPDATDGVSYGPETIVVTEVDVVTVDGLPAGLTFDDETFEVSGTPTTPGTYWITVSGDAGGCTITRLASLTVLEA